MARVVRNGVGLHYVEFGTGGRPVLLVHGILCDHRYFAPQLRHFARSRRTVAVDLRGHGRSDVPLHGHTIAENAADLAWLCEQLNLIRPLVVGHSLGGLVALQLAARHPDLVGGVVLLDSVLLAGAGREQSVSDLLRRLSGARYSAEVRDYFAGFFGPFDDSRRREWILDQIVRVPSYVAISIWKDGTFTFDDADAAAAVGTSRVPLLYVDAGTPNVDLEQLRRLVPAVMLARTVGAGHFHQLEVPDQVNAMIDRFLQTLPPPG